MLRNEWRDAGDYGQKLVAGRVVLNPFPLPLDIGVYVVETDHRVFGVDIDVIAVKVQDIKIRVEAPVRWSDMGVSKTKVRGHRRRLDLAAQLAGLKHVRMKHLIQASG
jgi:hypothetical protein